MALLTTLLLGIAPAVGKAVARMILQDDTAPAELAAELVELLKVKAAAERAEHAERAERAERAEEVAKRAERIEEAAEARRMEPLKATERAEEAEKRAQADKRAEDAADRAKAAKRVEEAAEARRRAAIDAKVEVIALQVAQKIRPLLDESRLPANEREAVTLEVVQTLVDAQIDAAMLIDCALDPKYLTKRLIMHHDKAKVGLSDAATRLYHRALEIAAIDLIALANELDSFERLAWARGLQNQNQILTYLAELHARPLVESATFLQDYRNALRNAYERLELFGIPTINDAIRCQQLTMAYVTLEAEPTSAEQRRVLVDNEMTLLERLLELRHEHVSAEIAPVERVIAPRRRVVLRGEAGAGKTTLLRWLAVRAATHSFPPLLASWNDCVPFLIPLRKWASEGFPPLDQFLGDLERTVGRPPPGWVRKQLRSGRALLLIDGVDELPQARRAAMLEGLSRLVAQYPLPRYIVTSRPLAVSQREWSEWAKWTEKAEFSPVALREMDQSTSELLIDRWHEALAQGLGDAEKKAELPELPGNLKRLLRTRPVLRRLANNPLLCAMICALHRENGQNLPAQRVELYQQCIEMLLHRRDEGRNIPPGEEYPNLSNTQKLLVIRDFALSMRSANQLAIDTSQADASFNYLLQMVKPDDEGRGATLRKWFFTERANLLHEPIEGQIEFRHRTFQDYLTALALATKRDIDQLANHAEDEQWHDIITLAAGKTEREDTDKLIEKILSLAI